MAFRPLFSGCGQLTAREKTTSPVTRHTMGGGPGRRRPMLVCVTGGTGFVGAHSVAALTRIGHKVRILARTEAGVGRALAPLGVDLSAVDVVVGDVTDE